jgi:hypothetical protein
MAIEKKSLIGSGEQGPMGSASENKAVQGTEPAKRGAARKLAMAKLVTTKLSTAKLATLKKLGG